MGTITEFMSFVKIEHSIFALPFIYAGALIAVKFEKIDTNMFILKFFLITLAAITARSTAMTLNRIIDAKIDALNPRTSNRHIPSGKIKKEEAIIFAIISTFIFFLSAYLLNFLCFILAPIPLIMFIIYPYLKRYTSLSHLFLGLCLGIGVGGGYVAITGSLENIIYPLILCLFVMFWVAGFDIIYAIQDVNFDKQQNLHSIPVKFGVKNALRISLTFHFISIIMLILFLYYAQNIFSSFIFFIVGILTIAALLFYEHKIVSSADIKSIINTFHLNEMNETVQKAFFSTNAVVGICFLIFLILALFF